MNTSTSTLSLPESHYLTTLSTILGLNVNNGPTGERYRIFKTDNETENNFSFSFTLLLIHYCTAPHSCKPHGTTPRGALSKPYQ